MLVNGQRCATVDALDRGLQYGDGLFETIAAEAGSIPLWERHMARLAQGCQRLGIAPPASPTLRDEVMQLIQGQLRCVVKIIVTRGVGGRGYRPPLAASPTRIVYTAAWPAYPQHTGAGIAIRVCTTPVARNKVLAGIKHLNRLAQVLARDEWQDPQIAEGLMLDDGGRVISATAANVFGVRGDVIYTPALDAAGVCGVMREEVLTLATQAGYGCRIQDLTLADMFSMDELFLTNSLIGLWPVRDCAGAPKSFTVGATTVGAQLQRALVNKGITWLVGA
ncbi:MAG: aminodeoxychorismate lyase [Pseudomonadota bacterium]